MNISCIVAMSKNRVIGKDKALPWHLPADLILFKKTTSGHHIVMGRKCFESIGRPLPNRTNVVITRNPSFWHQGTVIAHDIDQALNIAYQNGEDEVFIIGGGEIYNLSKTLWNRIYLTELDLIIDGDVYFPDINLKDWKVIQENYFKKDEINKFDFSFKKLERI